jgi:hypothetical protein
MCELENRALLDAQIKPDLYCRYVDDIFVIVLNEDHMMELLAASERTYVLTFTYEFGQNPTLPFLDILVQDDNNSFVTKVYRRPKDVRKVLNQEIECPQRHKLSTIYASFYIERSKPVHPLVT